MALSLDRLRAARRKQNANGASTAGARAGCGHRPRRLLRRRFPLRKRRSNCRRATDQPGSVGHTQAGATGRPTPGSRAAGRARPGPRHRAPARNPRRPGAGTAGGAPAARPGPGDRPGRRISGYRKRPTPQAERPAKAGAGQPECSPDRKTASGAHPVLREAVGRQPRSARRHCAQAQTLAERP